MNFAVRRLACWKEDLYLLNRLDMAVPPFACRFCKVIGSEDIAAIANEDGAILLLDTSKKPGHRVLTSWLAHSNAIFDVSWLPGEPKLISVSGDHSAALWDVLEKKCLGVFTGHKGTVKCADMCPTQNAVFATGSRDGSVRIWDLRVAKEGKCQRPEIIIETISSPPRSKSKSQKSEKEAVTPSSLSSVTSLVFQNEHHVVSSGVTDGVIKVWDLRKTYCSSKKQPVPRYLLSHGGSKVHGFTNLTMDSSRTQLYANCTNSVIYHYNCHTYNPQYVNSYYGHRTSSYYIKIGISFDDKYLMSGSGDRFVYIWELEKPSLPLLQLPGHTEEVTAVAWSPSDLKAISCGDDDQILIWDIGGEQEEGSGESAIHRSAIPYDVSKLTKAPQENSSLCDVEVKKSETPSIPRKRSLTSQKNVATKKKVTPKPSSLSITQWFSPVDSSVSVKSPQKRNTPSEGRISDDISVKANSATDFSSVNEPSSKRRKSGESECEERNTKLLSSSQISSVDRTVSSPDKTDRVVDSGILSPSKLNSVTDRVLSPSKTNCMLDCSETADTRKALNLSGPSRNEVDEPFHKVSQNTINKENVFCYEISPTRILDMCSREPENCVPKGNKSESLKSSDFKRGVCAVQKSSKKNRITKKTPKRNNKEEKKAERSIATYFFASPSGCCS